MEFGIHFPIESIKKKINITEEKIDRKKKELLELIGYSLVSFAKADYRAKSRGGVGSDGTTWKKNAPSTIARKNARGAKNHNRKTTKSGKSRPGTSSVGIGIDSGLQQSAVSPGYDGYTVTVAYRRSYSKYFDEERSLLPEDLPESWQEAIHEITLRHVTRIIREGLTNG